MTTERALQSFDPGIGLPVAPAVAPTPEDAYNAILEAARVAFDQTAAATLDERSRWLGSVADQLESRRETLVAVADAETGLGAGA